MAWSVLGSGVVAGASPAPVYALATNAPNVYVGGCFTTAGGKPSNNFAVWNEATIPVAITKVAQEGNNMRITWNTVAGGTNFVQATRGTASGSYSNNFSDISTGIVVPGSGAVTTNFVESGGATNRPARYYRVRLVQ